MKNLIKTIIALAFILGSYFLGCHSTDEKHTDQLKELNEKLSVSQLKINQLSDSINSIRMLIIQNASKKADTVITKSSEPQKAKWKK